MNRKIKISSACLALLTLLLNACAQTGSVQTAPAMPEASPTSAESGSGINGSVTIGPTCPGPVRAGDTSCNDKPYQAKIIILDPSQKEVAQVQSDINGKFHITLPSGEYTLHPLAPGMLPRAQDQTVEVTPEKYIEVNISYDTGMR